MKAEKLLFQKAPSSWYSRGMVHSLKSGNWKLDTAVAAALACGAALGGNVDFALRESVGSFDTAVVRNGALVNLEDTDARYSFPLSDPAMHGTQLEIDATVRLSASNAVWMSFGEALSLGCEEGRWHVLVGDAMLPFDDNLPPSLPGVHDFRIRLVVSLPGFGVNLGGAYRTTIQTFTDGIPDASPSVILGGAWQDLDCCPPSLWASSTASLRGANSAIVSSQYGASTPPLLILVR